MRKSYRGRRRRGLHPIVLIVPLALAGVFFLGQMRNRAPAGDSPAPPPADTPAVQGDQSPLPEHASTSSGAGCTLTELGEEAYTPAT